MLTFIKKIARVAATPPTGKLDLAIEALEVSLWLFVLVLVVSAFLSGHTV